MAYTYSSVDEVVAAIRRAAVDNVPTPSGTPGGQFDTDGLAAARYGRVVSITRGGATQSFDLGSSGMARFMFQKLTKVA